MTQITIPNEPIEVTYAVVAPSTGPFVVPFSFLNEEDVFATVTDALGVEFPLVLTTDFTFTDLDFPVGQEGIGFTGGEITLLVSIGADLNSSIRIYRSTIIDRTANFPTTGPFNMAILNDELNDHIAIMQELAAQIDMGGGDLQQVTDLGNSTTNDINLTAGGVLRLFDPGDLQSLDIDMTANPARLTVTAGAGIQFLGASLEYFFDTFVRVVDGLTVQSNGFVQALNSLATQSIRISHDDTWGRLETTVGSSLLLDSFDGGVYMPNIAAAGSTVVGFGQIWVNTVPNPSTLMFTNENSDDIDLTSQLWFNAALKAQAVTSGLEITFGSLFLPNGGVIEMDERSVAPGLQPNQGGWWVRSDTPNVPMFTDDAGTDFVLNDSGGGDLQVTTDLGFETDNNLRLIRAGIPADFMEFGQSGTIGFVSGGGATTSFDVLSNLNFRVAGGELHVLDSVASGGLSMICDFGSNSVSIGAIGATDLDIGLFGARWANVNMEITVGGFFSVGVNGGNTMSLGEETSSFLCESPGFFRLRDDIGNNIQARVGTNGIAWTPNSANDWTWTFEDGMELRFEEKATALANIAAFGSLWVRDDIPNVLVFTDDAGTDTVIGAAGAGSPFTTPLEIATVGNVAIGGSQDALLSFTRLDTTPLADLGFFGAQELELKSYNHGARFVIKLEDTAGVERSLVTIDPDTGFFLTAMNTFSLTMYDGATFRTAIAATHGGTNGVDMRCQGVLTARVTTAAIGGMTVLNGVTGGPSLERVLTTSDSSEVGAFNQTVASAVTWASASGSTRQYNSGAIARYLAGVDFQFGDNAEMAFGDGADVVFDFNAVDMITVGPAASIWAVSGFDQFRVAGSLGINQAAVPDGDVADVGQVWVRSDTPNTLMFTDDVGTDFVLSAAPTGTYTRNATIVEDRTLLASASATTINNNNVLAALIADLTTRGIIG